MTFPRCSKKPKLKQKISFLMNFLMVRWLEDNYFNPINPLKVPTEVCGWFRRHHEAERDVKPRGARDDGKSEGVMSIRMYDSINHRSVEDHPLGPQDGVGRIQQNNGLLCSRLPLCYFVFYFQAPQAGVKVNSSSRLFSLAGHAFVDGSLHPFFFFYCLLHLEY